MQERDEEDQHRAEACGEGTRFSRPLTRANCPSIDINIPSSIDSHPKPPSTVSEKAKHNNNYLTHDEFVIFRDPDGYARVMDGHALKVSREDIADILQMANGAANLFVQQRKTPEHQKRVPTTSYNTSGGVDDRFKPKYRQLTRPSIDSSVPPSIDRRPDYGKASYNPDGIRRFHWGKKDEYGVYRDAHGHARGIDGDIIYISKDDIRSILERASIDEQSYICLPEHATSFTNTKLVPEIYTKDEINEIVYGFCGAQGNSEDEFQMKLDGVYYPLNDSISWLTTHLEEMRQDIANVQTQCAAEEIAPPSIDRNVSTSIDTVPSPSIPTES